MPVKKKFKAFVIENVKKHGVKDIDLNFLMEGNVLVKVSYSSFNYKDGLAIVKKIPVIKKFTMIPGVDGFIISIDNNLPLSMPVAKIA